MCALIDTKQPPMQSPFSCNSQNSTEALYHFVCVCVCVCVCVLEYIYLYYTVGHCWLSILYRVLLLLFIRQVMGSL